MKRAIVINSMGPLDMAAITLMGLSSKREDREKIGMFGTGLKYSVAKLMRDGVPFRVWNGDHEVKFETRAGNFRGATPYQQVIVDGEPTSITTDMGPQWETWWVVRELLSNARDEQAHEFFVADWDAVEFKEGWTTFALDYDTFEQVWLAREKYFVTDRHPKYSGRSVRILSRWAENGTRIYKNGILIYEDQAEDAYDYDLLTAELNEMREPRYESSIGPEITAEIMQHVHDEALLRNWIERTNAHLRHGKDTYTGSLSFYRPSLSVEWQHILATTEERFHAASGLNGDLPTGGIVLPSDVVRMVREEQDRTRVIELAKPTKEQEDELAIAFGLLFENGFKVTAQVRVCEFGGGQLAQVIDGVIALAPSVFKQRRVLIECLLEEQLHITSGAADCTRSFQNAIFGAWAASIMGVNVQA